MLRQLQPKLQIRVHIHIQIQKDYKRRQFKIRESPKKFTK